MFARRRLNKILGNSDNESSDGSSNEVINLAPRAKDDDNITVSSNSPCNTPERKKKSSKTKTTETKLRRSETAPVPPTGGLVLAPSVSSTPLVRSSSDPQERDENKENRAETIKKREACDNLAPFDACVEACDALAANGGSTTGGRHGRHLSINHSSSSEGDTENTEEFTLEDCSVMVSPDGTLLFLPKHRIANQTDKNEAEEEKEADNAATLFYPNEDIQSAIITGSDLHQGGDKSINGFSSKGWASGAASTSIRQSEYSLKSTAAFVEELVLSQKEGAARTMNACDTLRGMMMSMEYGGGGVTANAGRVRTDSSGDASSRPSTGKGGKKGLSGVRSKLFRNKRRGTSSTLESEGSLDSTDYSLPDNVVEAPPGRVGPLFYPNSTLHGALMAFEQYQAATAEEDAIRWRRASSIIPTANGSPTTSKHGETATPGGILPSIRKAAIKTSQRADRREKALYDIQQRVNEAEEVLLHCREDASAKWHELHKAEREVERIVQMRNLERSQERERRRVAMENEKRALDAVGQLDTGTTQQEIWELVAGVAEDMEGGSFAPTGLPMVKESGPRDKALDEKLSKADDDIPEVLSNAATAREQGQTQANAGANVSSGPSSRSESPPLPMVDRIEIEVACDVPSLRAAALAADDAVEDAAGTLLNRLSVLDTTQRSARIAAEGCLLSACNAQASCLRSLVELERASIENRLRYIEGLEQAVDAIDVRADINNYIEADTKNTSDGATRLGVDDDGGIASGLAVLNSHSETVGGGNSFGTMRGSMTMMEGWGNDDDDGAISREDIEEAIEQLLLPNPLLSEAENEEEKEKEEADEEDEEETGKKKAKEGKNQEREQALQDIEKKVAFLTEAIGERSSQSRGHRASTCYALNSQRSIRTEVPSSVQFDGLCRVFRALLNGCDCGEPGDVANAKMCMMLAQTFYVNGDEEDMGGGIKGEKKEEETVVEANGGDSDKTTVEDGEKGMESPVERKEKKDDCGEEDGTSTKNDRTRRIYANSRLSRHPLFSDEDFWDQALFQCVSESLTKSGVMMNFEKPDNRNDNNNGRTVTKRKIRWYDLGADERLLAASQVHAVVFAQLGALAHSMVEFGCSIEQACAFVRRLSIRHQLPLSQRAMLLQHLLRGEEKSSEKGTVVKEDLISQEKEGEIQWRESWENQI